MKIYFISQIYPGCQLLAVETHVIYDLHETARHETWAPETLFHVRGAAGAAAAASRGGAASAMI